MLKSLIIYSVIVATSTLALRGNDEFARRVTIRDGGPFWASVSGSTFEEFDPTQLFTWRYVAGGSKWWTWTARETGFAVLVKQTQQPAQINSPIFAIYAGNDLPTLDLLSWYEVNGYMNHQAFAGFNTTVGQPYCLGFVGDRTDSFYQPFVLGVADSPIIVEAPATQSLNAGDTVVFLVSSPSLPAGRVQWQFNSVDIPNATNSTLSIYNLRQAQAGSYTATIEAVNNEGAVKRTVSAAATLTVNGEIFEPGLSIRTMAGSTNEFLVKVLGQPRQWYRIESTLDFVTWQVEPIDFIFDTVDSGHEVRLPSTVVQTRFLRARHLGNAPQSCSANLERIHFAKELSAMAHHHSPGTVIDVNEIKAYIGEIPQCPQGGTYTLNSYATPPACSLTIFGHRLDFYQVE